MSDRLASVISWTKGPTGKHAAALCLQRERESDNARSKAYQRNRRAIDPEFKVRCALRGRIGAAIRARGTKKHATSSELIGCSIPELRRHIEGLWLEGMTWDNYGDWHIDHIKPCAKFDLLDPEQQRACFHYSNLQPLWAIDNLKKGAR